MQTTKNNKAVWTHETKDVPPPPDPDLDQPADAAPVADDAADDDREGNDR
ncbi:hypothetical protein OWR29_27260 [Actinoplanes sp. Pm04-4]|uniref:Uncharacterized protein n=1 Tax=Paractinoplanes pyxinae TaxID=2997416 RepID=A0ABT4B5D3_9ACTN|nr:hypothetical protein [Actinoplanes pyxinae]MCY1141713.1 hypothetical protein [Actinoplanes pyxinae]